MRGQKIYNEIIKQDRLDNSIRKGRNNTLLLSRNECMIARYYYYGYMKNKGFEEILRLLVSEFFLSPSTIAFQVQEHAGELQALKKRGPSLHYFQNRWPHIKW